ncbi:MAG TPA: hypothetical protein ENI26_13085 [Methylophaga aminisulfidivorans]|uniref:Uncharacterized protein n=1 Tax=Methylophaga aminisulfidivorans TaxID=230105 RepID=A0A7C1W1M3_9GAMM|nr:hypothetical protein [Methylophaga aminisulfidivorans]
MSQLPIFLDFEASSLSYKSHPIEVAWSDRTGKIVSFLIKPEPSWTDWDEYAEKSIHLISREKLINEGFPAGMVIEKMTQALTDSKVYTSDASFDSMWCQKLFDCDPISKSLPFQFRDFHSLLESHFGVEGMPSESTMLITQKRVRENIGVRHRASADVQYLRDLYISLISGY